METNRHSQGLSNSVINPEPAVESVKKRRVLAIDDSKTNLFYLKSQLERTGIEVLTADNAGDGIEIARTERPDLILLDVVMGGIDGYRACELLKDDTRTSMIPVIFISASDEGTDRIKGLQIGAVDYIGKPFNPGELRARVASVLRTVELEETILSMANTDELTGLYNRRYFMNVLEREVLQAKLNSSAIAAVMFDIDFFKSINDTYGHHSGDMILTQMGRILTENAYPLDVAARYGGEEFIIFMPESSYDRATQAAERLRAVIDHSQWQIPDEQISVTVSGGIAVMDPSCPCDSQQLIDRADNALYAAKSRGRNRVVRFDKLEGSTPGADKAVDANYKLMQNKINKLSRQLSSQMHSTITAFTRAIDISIKDPYIITHAKNVKDYASAIAEKMNLSDELCSRIETAAMLQDLGKICIPDEILKKQTPLTDDERLIVQRHVIASTEILKPLTFFRLELQIIRHGHENFDGTGYPDGLKGRQIPVGARILRVADAFDAMTSRRFDRDAMTAEEALSELRAGWGVLYDPEIVGFFLKCINDHKTNWPLAGNHQPTACTSQSYYL